MCIHFPMKRNTWTTMCKIINVRFASDDFSSFSIQVDLKRVHALPNISPWNSSILKMIFMDFRNFPRFEYVRFLEGKKFGGKISLQPFLQHRLSRCCTRSWAKLGPWRWSDLIVRHTSPRRFPKSTTPKLFPSSKNSSQFSTRFSVAFSCG